jgi:outer membrane protein assembly factor BamB/Icc-related predicted phosphoesterase
MPEAMKVLFAHLKVGPAMVRVAVILFCLAAGAWNAQAWRFAWLSDTHVTALTGAGTPAADLQSAVTEINAMTNIDFVIISGDITEMGWLAQYTVTKGILDQLHVPLHLIPGNHDTVWSESGGTDLPKLWGADRFVFDWGGYTFIGLCQGPVMQAAYGHWAPQDIRWLDGVLNSLPDPSRPLIFVSHYPLANTGDITDNWYEVLDRLKKYNTQVGLVGHLHANSSNSWESVPGIVCRANYATSGVRGYNLVEITNNLMKISQRTNGVTAATPWVNLALGTRNYSTDTNQYARPDYSMNTNYPTVTQVWQFCSGYQIAASPVLWKDLAIMGDASGTVSAIRLDNGTVRWRFKTQGPIYSTPDVAGDIVIIASDDGAVYALEAANGKEVWRAYSPRPIVACPRVDGNRVFIGSDDGKFRAFDVNTGKTLWIYAGLQAFIQTRPLVYQGKVIFGSWDGYMYALDETNGQLLWKTMPNTSSLLYAPAQVWPVAANGKVFIAAPDKGFTALDVNTGQTVWRTTTYAVRETLGLSEDLARVYARLTTDKIMAVSSTASTATQVWSTNAGFGTDFSASQIVEKGGTVFYGTMLGVLIALDPMTGAIKWQYRLSPSVLRTAVPLSGSRVLVPDYDGRLTLLQGPAS